MATKINIFTEDKCVIFTCLDCGDIVMPLASDVDNFEKVKVEYQIFVLNHVHPDSE